MKNIYFVFTMTMFLFGCNKPIYDYRSKYVGTFHVTQYSQGWVMGQGNTYDTSHFDIKVRRSNEMYRVDFISDNGETTYILEKDGKIRYKSYDWHYQVGGEFIDKSTFTLSGGYYGLGGGSSFTATGTKTN